MQSYVLNLAKVRYQQFIGIELEKKMGLKPQRMGGSFWTTRPPKIYQPVFTLASPRPMMTVDEARVELMKAYSIISNALHDPYTGLQCFLPQPVSPEQIFIDLDFNFDLNTEEGLVSASLNWGKISYYYPHGRYVTETFEEARAKL